MLIIKYRFLIMRDLLRDSVLGQVVRFVTNNKMLLHPEHSPQFTLPDSFNLDKRNVTDGETTPTTLTDEGDLRGSENLDLEASRSLNRQSSNWHPHLNQIPTQESLDIREARRSREIRPTLTQDGKLLVTWYTIDDPENPQNWSSMKKLWVSFLIW